MAQLFPGRYTGKIDGPFVVFLIGMRVNRLWAIHKWMPVANAMPPMLEELARSKDLGLLGFEVGLYWRGVQVTQYWRSFEQLHAYAHARDKAHLPGWAAFNRAVGNDGSVGIWHETYEVNSGKFESIYVNMPSFGLGRAADHEPVTGRTESTKQRMSRSK